MPNRCLSSGIRMTSMKPSSTEARKVVDQPSGQQPPVGPHQPEEAPLGPHRQPCRGREQRDRQDHFLGRHAAVEERAAVAGLVLAQLGGIDEEAVARGQQEPGARRPRGEPVARQVVHHQRGVRLLGPEVVAELVAQVRGRVALGEDRGRRVAVDRAVVGREQHRHARAARPRAARPSSGERSNQVRVRFRSADVSRATS